MILTFATENDHFGGNIPGRWWGGYWSGRVGRVGGMAAARSWDLEFNLQIEDKKYGSFFFFLSIVLSKVSEKRKDYQSLCSRVGLWFGLI